MRRDYYLHKRKNGIIYVEFVNSDDGKKLSARSTGETDEIKARVKAEFWKINGIPTGRKKKPRPIEEAAGIETIIRVIRKSDINADDALRIVSTLKSMGLIDIAAVDNTGRGAVSFADFLMSFWDYDKSEYIQDKLAHGHRFTRYHARRCLKRAKSVLVPFWGDKKLNCVNTDDLKKLSRQLAGRGLSASTINQILLVACIPLKWAFNEKIISSNPATGLTKFSITNKERGILTETEAAEVLAADWKDKRAFVASLISATTGARQGECVALRRSDIGEDTLSIIYNYSPLDGLKCPKNGHKRIVPLLPEVRAALFNLLNENPHIDKENLDPNYDPFIFFSLKPDQPVNPKVILCGLQEVLKKIGVDYKGRNITFHSWRHWFCSKITQQIEGEKVAKVSGHLSESVFRKYADHIEAKNIQEVGHAAAQAFGKVLQFKKVG